jgi:hypothetical protein
MANFRYVLLVKRSATECSQVQPRAELTRQVLPKAPKIPNTKSHVAQGKNTNNVVVNKPANPHKIRDCGFFLLLQYLGNFTSKKAFR